MNDTIEYRPFRGESWFVSIELAITIFCFVIFGCLLRDISFRFFSNVDLGALFFLIAGTGSIWCLKRIYDDSNIIVFFEPECLRIVGGKRDSYCCIPWGKITHAYYMRNYKGVLHLILSPETLDKKQVKKRIKKLTISAKLHIDAVVIPVSALTDADTKKISEINTFIEQKIENITDYSKY